MSSLADLNPDILPHMRYSQLFGKTLKQSPKGAEAINHKLLVRAGFIDQLMSGSFSLLSLGFRVVWKINQIIREEINATGAQELLMPLMHPRDIWNETGRWDSAREVMYQFKDTRDKEYALSFTHEEIVMDLVRKHITSYQDLPVKIYHFSTKFRNELRAKSGILRGREFMMKDLYSIHESEADLMAYYHQVKDAYLRAFERLGLKVLVTEASGGVFTDKFTHEFQVLTESGEDTVFYCDACQWARNAEIFTGKEGDGCSKCRHGKIVSVRGIEVGNIFPLGQMYAQKMGVKFTDKKGKLQTPWFGSYGIGPTRVMGTIVEISHDEKGIIWPKSVSPYHVHFVDLRKKEEGRRKREAVEELEQAGIEVLWDDRENVSAGEKFADADLIGIPWRAVISTKTGEKVEVKRRGESKTELINSIDLINLISN